MTIGTCFLYFAQFCIQVFPVALFLFLPFEASVFRIRRRPLYTGLIVSGILGAAVYPFFTSGDLVDLYLDCMLFLLIVGFYFLNRERFTKKSVRVFISVFSLKAQNILAMAYSAAKMLLSDGELSEDKLLFQDSPTVLLLYLGAGLFLPLMLLFEKKILREYLRIVSRKTMWMEIGILALLGVTNFVFIFFCVGTFAAMELPVWSVIPATLFLLLIYAMLYFILFQTALIRAKDVEEQMHTALLWENTVSLQREMEHSRDIYHDLRQLLRQLNAVSEQDGFSDLKPYIEKIVSLTEHTDIFFCENKCLNALFQYYTGYANEKHIPLRISAVCGEISIADADLTLLMSNALENALTAAKEYRKQTGKEPEITAVIGIIKNKFAVQITNSCCHVSYAPQISEKEKESFLPAGAFVSTREEGGRGLNRIQWIADKYQGRASFRFDSQNAVWTTRISLTVKKGVS